MTLETNLFREINTTVYEVSCRFFVKHLLLQVVRFIFENKLILRNPLILKDKQESYFNLFCSIFCCVSQNVFCGFRNFHAIAQRGIQTQFNHLYQFLFSTSQRN